jgi:hypothetical protein
MSQVSVELDDTFAYTFVLVCSAVGFLFGVWNWWCVMSIKTEKPKTDDEKPLLIGEEKFKRMNEISELIQKVSSENLNNKQT